MPKSLEICYNHAMILVIGGSGFIGQNLLRQLDQISQPYRLLLHPTKKNPDLNIGKNFEVALSSLDDEKGIRAALKDVETIYFLSDTGRMRSFQESLFSEVEALRLLMPLTVNSTVNRFFYLSDLGADRASAFALLKAKGIAENIIKESGINYTIFRAGIVFGEGDNFSQFLAKLIHKSQGFVMFPGTGKTLFQPLWVEDLVMSLLWALNMPDLINQTVEIGGPEHLSFKEVITHISSKIRKKLRLIELNPVQFGLVIQLIEKLDKGFPSSEFWLDYLAEDRICSLDAMSRIFGINPARFKSKIDYLI